MIWAWACRLRCCAASRDSIDVTAILNANPLTQKAYCTNSAANDANCSTVFKHEIDLRCVSHYDENKAYELCRGANDHVEEFKPLANASPVQECDGRASRCGSLLPGSSAVVGSNNQSD